MKLVVTIPAYNERETIAGVIKEIPASIEGIDSVEVIVIDDGSTDNTAIDAIKAGADEVVTHKNEFGRQIYPCSGDLNSSQPQGSTGQAGASRI